MKSAVAITLIIAGVVVVAMPPLSDAWRTLMFTRLMEHGASSVDMQGQMDDLYRIGCWAFGAAMIAIGIMGSFAPMFESRSSQRLASAHGT
jgi:hypothetical protein